MSDLVWQRAQSLLADVRSLDDFATGLYAAIARDRPEVVASLMRVRAGRLYPLGRSPLSDEYDVEVSGSAIGEGVGACGTAAARRAPVLTRRFAGDPLWASLADAGVPDDIETCWSTPVVCDCGKVLGTLAFYWRELVTPSPRDRELADACVDVCRTAFGML
jgi:hypothetical protein